MDEKEIKNTFKGFRPTILEDNDQFMVINFGIDQGVYVRFFLDKEKGVLAISGDMGACVSDWYLPTNIMKMAEKVQDIDTFIKRIQAASDIYTFDRNEIIEGINREMEQRGDLIPQREEEQYDIDFESLAYEIDYSCKFSHQTGMNPSLTARRILEKYGIDWTKFGRKIADRVYLWSAGLNMAVKQLIAAGRLR